MTGIDPGSLSEMAHFPQQYICIKYADLLLIHTINNSEIGNYQIDKSI
jgi:hypothetical protein